MAKKKKEINFSNQFKTKRVTGIFAITALIFGFLFIRQSAITGDIILKTGYLPNLPIMIGISLILCSIVLGISTLKN